MLDNAAFFLRVLPETVKAVSGKADMLVDSGFKRGTDVLRALAMGAPSLPTDRETIMTEELLSKKGEIGVRGDIIVAEEGCPREKGAGDIGAHLRREGLDSSHFSV